MKYYTQEILDFVNSHFNEDFIEFNYDKVIDVKDLV